MNKNLILAIIAVIGLGGIGYMVSSKSSSEPKTSTQVVTNSKNKIKSSMKQLLRMGKNVSCEINDNGELGTTSGKINISGQKMMGNFQMKDMEGKMGDSHMINDGEFTYVWSSAVPQGTKIKNDAVVPAKSDQVQNNLDQDKEVDMDCSDWTPSSGSFNPPSDVDFIDMSSMMKGVIEKSGQPATDGDSVCDSVTDLQAKAICLQQIGN